MKKRKNSCKPIRVDSLTIGSCRVGFAAWDIQRDCLFATKHKKNHRCKWATPDGVCLHEGALDEARGKKADEARGEEV